MKAILLSINPEHALNILDGRKTLELRKRVPKDYVGWVYCYITKGEPYLLWEDDYIDGNYVSHRWIFLHDYSKERAYEIWGSAFDNEYTYIGIVNGLVIMRFWFDEYEKYGNTDLYSYTYRHRIDKLLKNACITTDDLYKYIKKVKIEEETKYRKYYPFYAWHIKKLEIFDKPMQLSEFYKDGFEQCEYSPFDYDNDLETCLDRFRIKRAPQSYKYVWVKE